MSAAILSLTSLDFLQAWACRRASLGELLSQGKNNIDAWWISLSTFAVLVVTLLLLTFMGDALRDDPRPTQDRQMMAAAKTLIASARPCPCLLLPRPWYAA